MVKTRARMSRQKRFLLFASILLIFTVAFGLLLFIAFINSKQSIAVPITAKPIRQGAIITQDKVTEVEIGKLGLTPNMIVDKSQVLNKFALRNFGADEYFFSSSVTTNYAKSAQEKAVYGAMAIPIDLIGAANGEIKENDFIKLYIVLKAKDDGTAPRRVQSANGETLPEPSIRIFNIPEMVSVRVLGIYDGGQRTTELSKEAVQVAEKEGLQELQATNVQSPSILLVDVTPAQQIALLTATQDGKIVAVVPPKATQDKFRALWGLIDSEGNEIIDETKKYTDKEKEELFKKHQTLQKDLFGISSDKSAKEQTSEQMRTQVNK